LQDPLPGAGDDNREYQTKDTPAQMLGRARRFTIGWGFLIGGAYEVSWATL
jgi:hypothetical protein